MNNQDGAINPMTSPTDAEVERRAFSLWRQKLKELLPERSLTEEQDWLHWQRYLSGDIKEPFRAAARRELELEASRGKA